jgi:hypothetical protein
MALPVFPNAISTNQMNVELSKSGSTELTMNDSDVRDLFAGNITNPDVAPFKDESQISFSNGHGKTAPFRAFITSNANDLNVRNYLTGLNPPWDENQRVVLTINSGVTISTDSAVSSSYALKVSGSFPNGIRIVNNGTIIGRGGPGGIGGGREGTTTATLSGTVGGAGSNAIYANTNVVIANNGSIRGGGGGGGGGAGAYGVYLAKRAWCGGGGGGGGAGSGSGGLGGLTGADSGVFNPFGTSGGNGTAGSISNRGVAGSAGSITASYNGQGVLVVSAGQNSGGNGGDLGTAGGSGGNIGSIAGAQTVRGNAAAGGSGGLAIKGSNFVAFLTRGTISGIEEPV